LTEYIFKHMCKNSNQCIGTFIVKLLMSPQLSTYNMAWDWFDETETCCQNYVLFNMYWCCVV